MKKFLARAVFACVLLVASVSWGTDYFVAGDGDDGRDGLSEATAWRTVHRANKGAAKMQPGDSLLFRRGDTFGDEPLKIKAGGAPGKPVIVGAFGKGAAPLFDGEGKRDVGIRLGEDGLSHVIIRDLHIANSSGNTGIMADADGQEDIAIEGVTIEKIAKGNGISLNGIKGFRVENVCIRQVSNNGIYVSSRPNFPAQKGIIRHNVVDGKGTSNDGITFHRASERKGEAQNGSDHLIEGNVSYHCGEQGFDLTSGSDFILRDNISFENTDGGILTSDLARNILIERHLSIRDAEKKGAVIIKHDGVRLVDSQILASRYHALVIGRGKGFEASGNLFLYDKDSKKSMIDVSHESSNAHFHDNRVVSLNPETERLVRFTEGGTAASTKSRFHHNVWWMVGDTSVLFQDDVAKKFGLAEWSRLYGQGEGSKVAKVDVGEALKLLAIPRKPTALEQKCWGDAL